MNVPFFVIKIALFRYILSSIAELEDFSAYKAANGFEAISQYANNLFTKPWRKEYKVIKVVFPLEDRQNMYYSTFPIVCFLAHGLNINQLN